MWTKETHINRDTNTQYWDSQWQKSPNSSVRELFKGLQLEYGRCVGKIYGGRKDSQSVQIGWVFQNRVDYEDRSGKSYIREVWVEVSQVEPKRAWQWTQPPVSPWEKHGHPAP